MFSSYLKPTEDDKVLVVYILWVTEVVILGPSLDFELRSFEFALSKLYSELLLRIYGLWNPICVLFFLHIASEN